jgi:hypothetical protein
MAIKELANTNLAPIIKYLKSNQHGSTWLKIGLINQCVRKGYHVINGKVVHTFDLVNVSIENPKNRGKGLHTEFLRKLKKLFSDNEELRTIDHIDGTPIKLQGLYAESVMNKRLAAYFLREGWKKVKTNTGDDLETPSFYLEF